MSKRARPEFGRALKPSYNLARMQKLERFLDLPLLYLCQVIANLAIIQHELDFLIRVTRTIVQTPQWRASRLLLNLMKCQPGSAQCGAFVTRCRLDENFFKAGIFLYGCDKQRI